LIAVRKVFDKLNWPWWLYVGGMNVYPGMKKALKYLGQSRFIDTWTDLNSMYVNFINRGTKLLSYDFGSP